MKNSSVLIICYEKDNLKDFVDYVKGNFLPIKICVQKINNFFLNVKFYGITRVIISMFINTFFLFFHLVIGQKTKPEFFLFNDFSIIIPYLFLCRIFSFMKPKKSIVIINFYVHFLGTKTIIKKILFFLLNDQKIILVVQSLFEKKYYSETNIKCKTHYIPYCQEEILLKDNLSTENDYIFSGGYTNRDYDCLLRAAKKINNKFIIICSRLNRIYVEPPANVMILKDVDVETFYRYLRNSMVVVIPLKEETGSSGQMVALAAMYFRKPIIYSDVSCLGEYFEEGVTGISYKKGNSNDLIEKLIFLLSDAEKRKELGESALKKYYEDYHLIKYYERLSRLFF